MCLFFFFSFMGLFDNIIGTANDGEEATDMDTIIENMAKPMPQEDDTVEESTASNMWGGESSGASGGQSGTGDDGNPGDDSDDDTMDTPKKKGKKKSHIGNGGNANHQTDTSNNEDIGSIDITGIDIGWDMNFIDITGVEDITVASSPVDTTPSTVFLEPSITTTATQSLPASEIPAALPQIPIDPVGSYMSSDIMPTEPTSSLFDITTPTISILDMSSTVDTHTDTVALADPIMIAEAPVIAPDPTVVLPIVEPIPPTIISPLMTSPTPDTPPVVPAPVTTPTSGSLIAKIGWFADELRWLKAADELLLQEKQDAKKRLEDAKKAIEDAEVAIDVEIQRIRDDEAAIDDTLASLNKR